MIDFQRPPEKQWSAPYWSAMHGDAVTNPCENMKMDFPVVLDLKVTKKVALLGTLV